MAHRFDRPGLWAHGLTRTMERRNDRGNLITVPVWNGVVQEAPHKLADPLGWRDPQLVFVNSMSDMFHEAVDDDYLAAVFGIMAACPHHTFQVLTKRADRMRDFMKRFTDGVSASDSLAYCLAQAYARTEGHANATRRERILKAPVRLTGAWPLPNVWLGVSVEDRPRTERIDALQETPAAVRFLSCEPLLEDLGELQLDGIHWVIIGGESGPRARAMDLDWARNIKRQCEIQGVAVFVKQLGRRWSDDRLSKCLKGGKMRDWPSDLQVREMPAH